LSTQTFAEAMKKLPNRNNKVIAQYCAGLSLIELMVALTVGLLITAGLTTLYVNTSSSYREVEQTSSQLENGRYAMQILSDEIQHAGFYGEYYKLALPPAALPDPCSTVLADLQNALPLPLQGYDAPAISPITCLNSANFKSGTDILVIHRAETTPPLSTTPVSNRVYIQANARKAEIQLGDPTGFVLGADKADSTPAAIFKKDGVTAADIRRYHVHIYFISPCDVMGGNGICDATDDGGKPIPTLKRIELQSGPSWSTVSLVQGIENFQVEYGIDTSGDGMPDSYVLAPANTTQWSNVVALRLYLLARNIDPSAGYKDTKQYNLGLAGTTAATNDAYKRHVYTALVRVNNVSDRKQLP
jgi:type IV pilus assembly protein PilW